MNQLAADKATQEDDFKLVLDGRMEGGGKILDNIKKVQARSVNCQKLVQKMHGTYL